MGSVVKNIHKYLYCLSLEGDLRDSRALMSEGETAREELEPTHEGEEAREVEPTHEGESERDAELREGINKK